MRNQYKYKRLAILLVLVFTLATVATVSTGTVSAVDLDHTCSVTFSAGGEEFADLHEASVVVDLYRVAIAVEVPGMDTYVFGALEPYGALGYEMNNDPTSGTWDQLAQQAAEIALGSEEPAATCSIEQTAENLGTGLYLAIARGADLEDYITHANGKIATIAITNSHTYSFSPVLIAFPSKREKGGGNTADKEDWYYNLSVHMKPEQDRRFTSMTISNILSTYSTGHPATFVFQIEGTLNGQVVYSDVASMVFTEVGVMTLTIENMPIGAEVTVTQVYAGPCYAPNGAAPGYAEKKDYKPPCQNIVIDADRDNEVSFTNEFNYGINDGGSITDHFEYNDNWDLEITPSDS